MSFTTIVDFAGEFQLTREDANNALKRYVHPDCIPATAAGQMRMLGIGSAKLLAFALQARAAGYSPETVRNVTRKCVREIENRDAAVAVLTPDGSCEVWRQQAAKEMTLAELVGPFSQQRGERLAIIDLAALQAKVDAAVKRTAESFGVAPRTTSGWSAERKEKVRA